MDDSANNQSLAELLKAFAHPTRLAILRELISGPKCVTDMEDLLPARQANISQHLAVLRYSRLVDYAQDGALRCYYLARPRLVRKLLQLVLQAEPPIKRTADQIRAEKASSDQPDTKAERPAASRRRPRKSNVRF
jgi:ArsR family transcriptional regulator